MKPAMRVLGLAAAVLLSSLAQANDDSPVGTWKTIDDETKQAKALVQISESGGVLSGKIIKLFANPDAKCDKCDGERKDKPVQGMTILWDLKKKRGQLGRRQDSRSEKRPGLQQQGQADRGRQQAGSARVHGCGLVGPHSGVGTSVNAGRPQARWGQHWPVAGFTQCGEPRSIRGSSQARHDILSVMS